MYLYSFTEFPEIHTSIAASDAHSCGLDLVKIDGREEKRKNGKKYNVHGARNHFTLGGNWVKNQLVGLKKKKRLIGSISQELYYSFWKQYRVLVQYQKVNNGSRI